MRNQSPRAQSHQDTWDPETENAETLKVFLARYKSNPRPISVNFRQIVPQIPYNSERASHYIHSYPAKLLLHIPHFFIANSLLSKPHDTVADPFCGSGTVLLEAVMAGRNALGTDTNPLACLVAKVKTTPLDPKCLKRILQSLSCSVVRQKDDRVPDVVNITHWFYPHVTKQLAKLKRAIELIPDASYRDFFWVCFSSCVRKVSLSDPRISVPVRLRTDTYPEGHALRSASLKGLKDLKRVNVFECFTTITEANISRIGNLYNLTRSTRAIVSLSDARSINSTARENRVGISLIVTSPPYAGAQKYVRASSLSLGWLDLCGSQKLRSLEDNSIGREHYRKNEHQELVCTRIPKADQLLKRIYREYPLRAHIAGNYLLEMRAALESMVKSLNPGGYIVLVAGNNYVCRHPFKTGEYLKQILCELGLTPRLELIDTIKSRGLMTKRNATANLITREAVMLFQKT